MMVQYFGRYGYNNCQNCGGIQSKRLTPTPENPLTILKNKILDYLKRGMRPEALSLLIHAPVDSRRVAVFYRKHFRT